MIKNCVKNKTIRVFQTLQLLKLLRRIVRNKLNYCKDMRYFKKQAVYTI